MCASFFCILPRCRESLFCQSPSAPGYMKNLNSKTNTLGQVEFEYEYFGSS